MQTYEIHYTKSAHLRGLLGQTIESHILRYDINPQKSSLICHSSMPKKLQATNNVGSLKNLTYRGYFQFVDWKMIPVFQSKDLPEDEIVLLGTTNALIKITKDE